MRTETRWGVTVRIVSLAPWGGPDVVIGNVRQPMPVQDIDRGSLRLVSPGLNVYRLEVGDEAPKAKLSVSGPASYVAGGGRPWIGTTVGLAIAAGVVLLFVWKATKR